MINASLRPIILAIDIDYEEPPEVRAQNILDQAQGMEIFDGGIYFLDQQGKVFKTQPAQPELIGQDWSDTPQFRYLVEQSSRLEPRSPISGPSDQTGRKLFAPPGRCTTPRGNSSARAITVLPSVQRHRAFSTKLLSSLDLGSDVYIIDGNQRIIFSPDPSQMGRDLSEEAYIQQLLQGQKMSIRFQKGTEDMVISYYPLDNVVIG